MKKSTLFLLILPLLFAFGKNKKPEHCKFLTKNYVKVPAGHLYTNVEAGFINVKYPNPIKDSCEEFFISNTEITNENWKDFLSYLKDNGRMTEYNANLLDTTVWRSARTGAYLEPFVNYYHQHSAYMLYPAVGMTLKQAQAYANWLTEDFAMKNKDKKIAFFVPSKKQWIRAARGGMQSNYPWAGKFMRDSKGYFLANFKTYDERFIARSKKDSGYEVLPYDDFCTKELTITASAKSYYPNQFGSYNMSGNVAELVSNDTVAMGGSWNDTGYDVRVESEQSAVKPSSTIGFRVIAVVEK